VTSGDCLIEGDGCKGREFCSKRGGERGMMGAVGFTGGKGGGKKALRGMQKEKRVLKLAETPGPCWKGPPRGG